MQHHLRGKGKEFALIKRVKSRHGDSGDSYGGAFRDRP